MTYEYSCPVCEKVIEVEYSMKEAGNLTPETLEKLKCPGFGKCEYIKEGEESLCDSIKFERVFSSISFLKFDSMTNEQKQQVLKKRAGADFKKNIEERKRVMQGNAIGQLRNTFGK